MSATSLYRRYSGWAVLGLLLIQIPVWQYIVQLEPTDLPMSVTDGGILVLPFALLLLTVAAGALRYRRWLPGSLALLGGLAELLIGSWSVYMWGL